MTSSLDNLEKTQLAPSARAAVTSLAFGSIPEVIAEDTAIALDRRLGYLYARERLGIEGEHKALQSGGGLGAFSIEKLIFRQFLIRALLTATGLYWRGLENAKRVEVRHNVIKSPRLPLGFQGYRMLHLSDLHADMNQEAMQRIVSLVRNLHYDVCVITGDFRGALTGPFDDTLREVAHLRRALRGPLYGVLGNHDAAAMVPALEEMGIRMLLNEHVVLERGSERIHLAGIDDAHFYQIASIEQVADGIPRSEFAILLSHSPEIYKQAAHVGFAVLISGHTHGGQICLPGGIPLTLDAKLPRHMGAGAWKYLDMFGYTSVGAGSSIVPVRFNCPPEITLHHFRRSG